MRRPRVFRLFSLTSRKRQRAAAEMDEEIRTHIELRTAQLMQQGWDHHEALAEAERRFGSAELRRRLRAAAQRRHEASTPRHLADTLGQDLRYAVRQLKGAPGFTAAAVISFALGIGVNATMFGVIDRLLLQAPPGINDPASVFTVQMLIHDGPVEYVRTSASYPLYRDLRDRVSSFASVAAQTYPGKLALGRGAGARSANGVLVSGSYFDTLGVRLLAGRAINPDDDTEGHGANVAVISERLWKAEFGGIADVIGTELDLGTGHFTVVGVASRGFAGADQQPVDVWIPLNAPAAPASVFAGWRTSRQVRLLRILSRLRAGVTVAAASAETTGAYLGSEEGTPTDKARLESIIPSRGFDLGPAARVAMMLAAVSTLVLLIACANVANLLLTRALRRRREIAIRLAMGVSRRRLALQLVMESLLLATMGGAAALLIVAWGNGVVQRVWLPDVVWPDAPIDHRVLAFTTLATVMVGLLAGVIPALRGAPDDLTRELRFGTTGAPRSHLRHALLVMQATLSVVLLVGTGLFVRSFWNATVWPLGIDVDRLLVASMKLQAAGFDGVASDALFSLMQERVGHAPGVAHVALAEGFPFHSYIGTTVGAAGRDVVAALAHRETRVYAVTPDYFATVGAPLLRGPGFARYHGGNPRVAVVNDTLARLAWPNREPIGQCLTIGARASTCSEVVGIVATTQPMSLVDTEPNPEVYVPIEQGERTSAGRVLLIRSIADDPGRLVGPIRELLQTVAPNLPYADVQPMRALLADTIRPSRLGATLFGAFGFLAVVLSSVGLFAATSYVVGQRMAEMGVRVALGASSWRILRSVLTQGVVVSGVGALLGGVLSLAGGPLVAPVLFHTSTHDPVVFGTAMAIVLTVGVGATLGPATRAAKADPLASLRMN